MHLSRFSAAALFMLATNIPFGHAAITPPSFLRPSCFQLGRVLANVDTESLVNTFKETVCNQGCRLSLSDYNLFFRDDYMVPMIEQVTDSLGIPEHAAVFQRMTDEAYAVTSDTCASRLSPSGMDADFCQDDVRLNDAVACGFSQLWPMIARNALHFVPLLSNEELCQRQVDYFGGRELWEEVLPSYMRKFAEGCRE